MMHQQAEGDRKIKRVKKIGCICVFAAVHLGLSSSIKLWTSKNLIKTSWNEGVGPLLSKFWFLPNNWAEAARKAAYSIHFQTDQEHASLVKQWGNCISKPEHAFLWASVGHRVDGVSSSDLMRFPMTLCCPLYNTVSHSAHRWANIRRVKWK